MKRFFSLSFALALIAVASYYFMYSRPMWIFNFKAPQYPQGLELQVFMTGTQGDVFEIDIINHYIGMQKLELAAQKERAMAPYVMAGLSALTLLIGLFPRKKFMRFISLPVLGFPFAFVGIFWLWLYRFGHDLNPAAPVRLTPFTPTVFGTGIIGQFTTFAVPGSGFYLACLSAFLVVVILVLGARSNKLP